MAGKVHQKARCAVIGSGSWATALVKILLENESRVGWYIREAEIRENLATNGTNPTYLTDVHFPIDRLSIWGDIDRVVEEAEIIVLAVPSAFLKATLEPLTVSLRDKFILSAVKGIITDEYITVAEYINRAYGLPFDQIGIVSGPSHAEEVALERLTYLTVVCKELEVSWIIGEKIQAPYIHVVYSTDIYGTEYATVLKNIYAVAVGICHGLGYGDNFTAVMISNSALEMERFMCETYPAERNMNASVYLGDLLVTCYSQFSRNRTFGSMIGKGYSVKSTMVEMTMVAEGYYSAACIRQINKQYGVRMPIADAVYNILYEMASPRKTIKNLANELI
ncbi:MAG: NAD(P)H-dependent glycerol-3-phosphate dehydrogenase [Rikenellaceae bacterium]|nr:NAD(P)H-dependent glycerol-3-phosphate dehydrogenase [Rikenellaceae bacterium]